MSCHNSAFVQEADKLLLQARTLGPSLRVDRTIISTDIDDPEYKNLGRYSRIHTHARMYECLRIINSQIYPTKKKEVVYLCCYYCYYYFAFLKTRHV